MAVSKQAESQQGKKKRNFTTRRHIKRRKKTRCRAKANDQDGGPGMRCADETDDEEGNVMANETRGVKMRLKTS